MSALNLPSLAELAKLQEQILLPLFVKLTRLQEQLWINIGAEPTANLEPVFREIYKRCQDQTLTPFKAMYATYKAASYVAKSGIAGDFVECGVWKGGSSMIAALTFMEFGSVNRKLYLYDTYEGMPNIGSRDENFGMSPFQLAMNLTSGLRGGHAGIFYASLEEVRKNMKSTGYLEENVLLVKGMVEDTIPGVAPEQISLLHLDSDLYQSTYHELTHLYPRLTPGGVLIIDDYDTWKGSQKATDEYFSEHGVSMLLTSIGSGGARMGIKA
ncbi:MAG: TylF/MycF/NovP-related O-methyltransferase [Acidobacteriaceae bacterium]